MTKFVSTTRGYEALNVDLGGKTVRISGTAVELSEENAAKVQKVADDYGMGVRVAADPPAPRPLGFAEAQPDLSAGVSAVSGHGAAVSTPDDGDDAEKQENN